jgi:heme A synthase
MLDTQAAATISPSDRLRRRTRAQLIMLIAQFLLGMAVNLIGLPSETTGGAKAVTLASLVVHIAIALGLLIGAILTLRRAAALGPRITSQSWIGLTLIAITTTAGILTMLLDNNWWSYLMAVGFIASVVVYGNLHAQARSR